METSDFMPGEAAIAAIRQQLDRYESVRTSALRKVRWRIPVCLGGFGVAVLTLAWAFNGYADPREQWVSTPHVYLYITAVFVISIVYGFAMKPAKQMQNSFRGELLPIVFGFIERSHYGNGETPVSFERLPPEIVGNFNQSSFDDVVSGSCGGFPFELYETTLSFRASKNKSTVFKGVIVAFQTLAPFPGVLIATSKSNMVVSFFKGIFGDGPLHEVESGIAEIDERYDFRTDNPEVALPLVQGRLVQALQWLAEAWPEEPARIALRGEDGYLLLPTSKDFFELPEVSVPLDYQAHIQPIIADMASLLATAALVRKVYGEDSSHASS